jgi:hypothetical protein
MSAAIIRRNVAVGILVVGGAVAIIASMAGPPSSPPEWLKAWTTFIGTAVTVALGIATLWEAPAALREFVIWRQQKRLAADR